MDVGEASTSGHQGSNNSEKREQGYDPEQQEIVREIFYDGMTDGLLEAQNSFPSLDIVKTRSAALNKGDRITLSSAGNALLPTVEMRAYTSGVLNGLIEAKLSFPDLDMWTTVNVVLSRRGIKASFVAPPTWLRDSLNNEEADPENLHHKDLALTQVKNEGKEPMDVGEASTSGHQGSDNSENNPQQEEIMRRLFYDGMTDGLLEAKNSFPSLDIVKTRSAVLNKGHRVAYLSSPEVVLPTDEMRTYTTGIVNGLLEAKLSFPDLDVWATVDVVLSRRGMKDKAEDKKPSLTRPLTVSNNIEEAGLFHKDFEWKRVKDIMKESMDDVGEASTSGHQGSEEEQGNDPQQQEIWRKIFCDGITDGLLEARKSFPSLNIIRTRRAAFDDGNRIVWSLDLPNPEGNEYVLLPRTETKIYTEGILNGLHQANLSFPDLDVMTTLNAVLISKRGYSLSSERSILTTDKGRPDLDDPLFLLKISQYYQKWETQMGPTFGGWTGKLRMSSICF
ncbi:TMV resistance protein N [Spatholobus suberectus]|nr:TMV resistance protein N [Spatholobus suberectus]